MPPARATSHNKLYVQLPGSESRIDASKANGQNGAVGGDEGNKNRGQAIENGTSSMKSENAAVGQLISVDFPAYANVLTLGFAAPESFEETSPTSNEESTTMTAESSSLDAEGLGSRRDMQSTSNRPTIGRVSSAPYDDRNGPFDMFGVQRYFAPTVSVKLNEKSSSQARRCSTNSEIIEEGESISGSSAAVSSAVPSTSARGGFRRDSSSSDVITHRFRTCSVVETDL